MISAEDLQRWGNSGLRPEAPAPAPDPPNFRGDDLHFIRYNGDGTINSRGKMHREHIDAEQAQGVRIEIVDDEHPDLDPPTQAGNLLAFGPVPHPDADGAVQSRSNARIE